jgi:hypothetical protein
MNLYDAAVRTFIERVADVNNMHYRGRTSLMRATCGGQKALTRMSIEGEAGVPGR